MDPPMFRFTIRDVLWLTVVAAVLAAWWLDHRRAAVLNRELLASLKTVESAMEAHGFQMQVDLKTGKAGWNFSPFFNNP